MVQYSMCAISKRNKEEEEDWDGRTFPSVCSDEDLTVLLKHSMILPGSCLSGCRMFLGLKPQCDNIAVFTTCYTTF